jgi:SAM-dependent methyltransferase
VHGIDISAEMLAAARVSSPGCTFEMGDARHLPFEDGSFDVVASMATLEFIPAPAAAVREMVRCARPGGSLLIGTLNQQAPLNQRRLSEGRQPYASAELLAPKELRALLAPHGTVRMRASRVRGGEGGAPAGRPPGRGGRRRARLSGPFIVAEVHL